MGSAKEARGGGEGERGFQRGIWPQSGARIAARKEKKSREREEKRDLLSTVEPHARFPPPFSFPPLLQTILGFISGRRSYTQAAWRRGGRIAQSALLKGIKGVVG